MVVGALGRADVLASRARGHGLAARRPRDKLVAAVAAIGMRRTRHTSVSLTGRVDGFDPSDLARALETEAVVVVYGPRGTRTVVPADDVAVFTVGAPRPTRRRCGPRSPARTCPRSTTPASPSPKHAVVVDALRHALAAGPRPRGETVMAVTRAVPAVLAPPCRGRCPDPHVKDSVYRLAGVSGTMRFVGDTDDLVAIDEPADPEEARTELVRRYLRCYGPSTPATFAAWAGISAGDARRSFAVEKAVTDGPVRGVRFLPAHDAWLLDRDRATLVPDVVGRRVLWRAAGSPGVVLVDAEPVAAWRTKTDRAQLALVVDHLPGAPPVDADELGDEAQLVGAALGATYRVAVRPSGSKGAR